MSRLAHRLNKRIRIQEIVETPNATTGGTDRTYSDYFSLWAEVIPVKSNEYLGGKQIAEYPTHKITIRFNTDMRKDLFINLTQKPHEPDRLLRIISMVNIEERNEYQEIMAKEIEEEV